MDEPIKSLVAEIINRIAKRLGATGARGELLVVFSGATVGLAEAINQVRRLIIDGYRIRSAFSDNAQNLIGLWIDDQLLGFPFVRKLSGSDWYSALSETRAVVVPALSLNTAAKVSSLIGDTLPTTLMLHALATRQTPYSGCQWSRSRQSTLGRIGSGADTGISQGGPLAPQNIGRLWVPAHRRKLSARRSQPGAFFLAAAPARPRPNRYSDRKGEPGFGCRPTHRDRSTYMSGAGPGHGTAPCQRRYRDAAGPRYGHERWRQTDSIPKGIIPAGRKRPC